MDTKDPWKLLDSPISIKGFNTKDFSPSFLSNEELYEKREKISLKDKTFQSWTGKKPPKIGATFFETALLGFMYNQKLLSSKQLEKLYKAYYPSVNFETYQNKLKRWSLLDVVYIRNDTKEETWGKDLNFYRVASKSIGFLSDKGYMPENVSEDDLSEYSDKPPKSLQHYQGIQEVVVNIIVELKKNDLSVVSLRPSDVLSNNSKIIPDWIMKYYDKATDETTYIHIEFDTGHEPLRTLHQKIENYIKLAEHNPESNHIGVIALEDPSLFTTNARREYKGPKRISNIKKYGFENEELTTPDNLTVYSGHLADVHSMVSYHLTKSLDRQRDDLRNSLLSYLESSEYTVVKLENDDVYMSQVSAEDYADEVYEVKNESGHTVERVGVIYCSKGDAKNLYRVQAFSDLITSRSFLSQFRHRLIVVYPTSEDLQLDYHGVSYGRDVLFTDRETLDSRKEKAFYITNTPSSVKEISYEE